MYLRSCAEMDCYAGLYWDLSFAPQTSYTVIYVPRGKVSSRIAESVGKSKSNPTFYPTIRHNIRPSDSVTHAYLTRSRSSTSVVNQSPESKKL